MNSKDESRFLKELVFSGALDEISNAEHGESIGRYVANSGKMGAGDQTRRAVLFTVYQTGRHGPQNGFRLALVKEGVTKEIAVERLKGEVVQDAAEYVIVEAQAT